MALPRTISGLRRFQGIIRLKMMMGLPLSKEQQEYLDSAMTKEELENYGNIK